MTTVIHIAYDVNPACLTIIDAHLTNISLTDPDWNGASFEVIRDDYTFMDDESPRANILFGEINRMIQGLD